MSANLNETLLSSGSVLFFSVCNESVKTEDPARDLTEDAAQDAAADYATPDFSSLREKINNLPPGDVLTVLLTLFDNADNDLQRAKQNVEEWFDNSMDWYPAGTREKRN